MDRRRAAAALLALAACIACTSAAPTASNQTALDLYESDASEGCYYNFQHYGEGDRIMTNEPCLNCTCHNRMLMCYLRVCPFTKAIGQDCTVEKRADQCCPIVTCPDVPVDLLTSTSTSSPAEYGTTGLGRLDKYGCSMNGKYFPEGSKVPPSPNKPCEHCYCIRNMTTCVMQECTLHVDGCTPIYHKDVCCPVRYSCDHPEDEIPLLDDMTTTVRPTPGFLLTTTTMPSVTQIPQDCVHDDQIFADGALIKTEKACEHCYCMKGDIVCVVQECGTPMENEGKNCTSLVPKEGQCCPDTYICEGDNELQTDDITTLIPPRRSGVEGSGYRNEDEYTVQPTVFEPELEGSGVEGSGLEASEMEGSGDEYKTDKPASTSDMATAPEVTTSAILIEKAESDIIITSEAPVFIPISTESPSLDSEKYTTEPDKGQNTVPSEDETIVPLVRETTISSIDIHTPEQETIEITTTEEQNPETPSELEQDKNLATTITPESLSSLPDVTSGEILKTTVKSAPAESITTKQTEESVTDAPEILKPLATTTEKQELSETQTIMPLDEKESKSTTIQLPDDTHESVDTALPHKVTTETSVEVSTAGEIKDKYSETTAPTEQDEPRYTTSSKFEIPETTSINPIENEIQEEVSPIASPGIIPGEGNCLVNGITYGNDSAVPSTNKCQTNCKCMSSIVKCDPIMCSGPPENMVNCQPVYDTDETCCPTFICDHGKETIPPQPHSQMSGTESPVTQEAGCQDTECRRQENDVPAPIPSPECLADNCSNESDQKDTNECGTEDCGEQSSIAEPPKSEVTKQPEVCLNGNCISPPESCVGDKCQLPTHKDQPCDKDNGCDVPLADTCEGPNCSVEITPPEDDAPICNSEADCGQSSVPDVLQTCEGEACEHVPSKLPSSEIPQQECADESCTKKEAAELEKKFETECKDETCTAQKPVQSIPETDDVKTESPVILDESGTITPVTPVIEEDDNRADSLGGVTTLSEIPVTNAPETITESIQVDMTESPISQDEPMGTKVPKPVEPSAVDTMVTESPLDSETKSATESPELSATEPTITSDKEADIPVGTSSEKPATEQPLHEGPVTEQQEMSTKSSQTPIVEEQEISSESPEVSTLVPKPDTESPEISEKPVVAEYPTTKSDVEISKTTATPLSEEHMKPTELSETSVAESEETSTKVTETSEEEKQTVTERLEIVTKTSESPVSEDYPVTVSQEIAIKSTEQSSVTEMQEVVTKVVDTSDISETAITQPQDEATNIPEVFVTEKQEKTTDIPVFITHVEEPIIPDTKEKSTESYEKPEYPVTDSEEKVTVEPEAPVSEEEKTPESAMTESQDETSTTSEAPISELKPEDTVTYTSKPLREGSVTAPQDFGTDAPENSATEATETASSEPKDKIPEVPKETEEFITESEEKATEVPQVTESEEKSTEVPKVTEAEKYGTEDQKEPESAVTVSEGQVTEVPIETKPTETDMTKSEDQVTESSKQPEPTAADVTEIEEELTDASKKPEADVTASVEKSTEAAILTVTESQEKLTAIPEAPKPSEEQESPESTITEAQEKPTDAPESTVSEDDKEVNVTESEEKASSATELPIPSVSQQSCDEESGCDIPLTQPCNGQDCGVDTTPPKEVPVVCDNKDNCDQSVVPEVPVRKCEGDACQPLPVSDEKQEPPASEPIEVVPETSDTPVSGDKQEKPESSATETSEMTTESLKVHVQESEEKTTKTPEVVQEQELELPTTEHETPLRESSVTEPQEVGTLSPKISTVAPETLATEPQEKESEYPEMPISEYKPETPTTVFGERATESPEAPLSGEKQDITVSPIYSEKATQSPEISTLSVSDSQEDIIKSPDTDDKQEVPDQSVTEYTEKATEIPETLISDHETEEASEAPATESTQMVMKTPEQAVLDEKQDIPVLVPIESEKETTDKPLRDGSVTESEEIGTQSPGIPPVVTELPSSEKETESPVTEPTKAPVSDGKQDIPESPVISPVTESHEKTTDALAATEQLTTDKHEEATKAPETQEGQETTDKSETESQEIGTKVPVISFEDHHTSDEQPATETHELATSLPEIVTSEEQEIHTEAPVSLVTGMQKEHDVSVAAVTESQQPTTRIQETSASDEPQTSILPKVTEATEATISDEQEVPASPATESQEKATAGPDSDEKQRIPEEPATEVVEKATEMSVTESQEKEVSEVTKQPEISEIQEKDSEVPQIQEKPTEAPILDEKPATESEDVTTMTPVEADLEENVEPSKSPVPDFQDMATEAPDAVISEQDLKEPDTSVSEADKPLREGSATEPQELGTEAPEIPKATGEPETQTSAPKVPELPDSETQLSETEAPATESEEDAITGPKVPASDQKSEEPETQETATEAPEVPDRKYQETGTMVPEIHEDEPQTPVLQEKTTESPEVSEAPEYQEKATEIPKAQVTEELPQAADSEQKTTNAPLSVDEQPSSVMILQEKPTEAPETGTPGQELESPEVTVPDAQEKVTEVPKQPTAEEDQELAIAAVTESQDAGTKSTDASSSEVPKQEYSETTPYLVELEEHTHKFEDESATTAPQDITTLRADESPILETEKPSFIPDMETISVAPTTLQEPISTEAGILDSKFGEPSEDQEVSKTPERTGEEQTSAPEVPIEIEKDSSSQSTEKPFESSASPEPNAPEEELLPSRTTTTKVEEETTTPALFDKFTKPEPKPSEDTYTPEIPKPTTTGQLSDDLPLPEDEAGQFPPSGSTGYGQEPDYVEEDQAFGPGTCRYGGKVYVSAQQIPRDDPCDFCFCFRSDIICLQQSCPPPIHGCHEEPISGFCCPRYECPVSMATTLNVTTTTTTTTTTLPPHFLPHAYKGQAQRRGCQIKGHTYKVGEVVRASSGPCLHCTCGGDGQMKCDPKQCTPEPMLRQMIAAAVSAKRRR